MRSALQSAAIVALCLIHAAEAYVASVGAIAQRSSSRPACSSFRLHKKIYHNDDGTFDVTSAPMLDFNENYYRLLGVDSNAPAKAIKKQFLKQIFTYHPDRVGKDDESAEELIALRNQQTMVINSAYRVLKDVTLRAEYDMRHREPVRVKSSTSSGGFGGKEKVVLTPEEVAQKAHDKAVEDERKKELKEKSKRESDLKKRADKERSRAGPGKAGRSEAEPQGPSPA